MLKLRCTISYALNRFSMLCSIPASVVSSRTSLVTESRGAKGPRSLRQGDVDLDGLVLCSYLYWGWWKLGIPTRYIQSVQCHASTSRDLKEHQERLLRLSTVQTVNVERMIHFMTRCTLLPGLYKPLHHHIYIMIDIYIYTWSMIKSTHTSS